MSARVKRQKTTIPTDPAEDQDLPTAHSQANAPSSSAWSTRQLKTGPFPSFVTVCLRVFALNLRSYSANPSHWESIQGWLKEVPDTLVPRLLATLRDISPNFLRSEFISAYLLRGPTLDLGDDLPGVNNNTIQAIARLSSREQLRELKLRGLQKISDDVFASVLSKLPSLQVISLRECTKVASKTAHVIAAHCAQLKVLNLGYTAVPPVSLAPVLRDCPALEVLKIAGIADCTDANVAKIWRQLSTSEDDDLQLPNLRTLKLRQTFVTDVSVTTILNTCPNLRRLDLSFTGVRHPAPLLKNTALEKLSLTSTKVSSADLLKIVAGMSNMKTLAVGALGRGGGSAVSVSNTTAMTMTDDTLRKLTDILVDFPHLAHVSLVGNTKLGTVSRHSLTGFISRVGRNCKILNFAGVSSLRSEDLEGLLPVDTANELEYGPSPLEVLVLNNTNVGDHAAGYISGCTSLQVLEVGATKFTGAGLFTILDACKKLERLNLTSCRGIEIAQRRFFFEVYERERLEKT